MWAQIHRWNSTYNLLLLITDTRLYTTFMLQRRLNYALWGFKHLTKWLFNGIWFDLFLDDEAWIWNFYFVVVLIMHVHQLIHIQNYMGALNISSSYLHHIESLWKSKCNYHCFDWQAQSHHESFFSKPILHLFIF